MKTLLSWQRSLLVLPVLLLALALLALACGDDDEEAVGTPEATPTGTPEFEATVAPEAPVVDVSLNEWSILPSVGSIEAGPITFSVTNEGSIPHEFEVFSIGEDVDIANLPVEAAQARPGEVGAVEIGEIEEEDLPAGAEAAATFTLEPGRYVFICNIPGHYEAGMFIEFAAE